MKPADIRIFQIYYRKGQESQLDPDFTPYDNRGDLDLLLEFNVFRKLAADSRVAGADYWGAVSWKFGQKTGLTGAELRETIRANPGYDAYFCNPHPDTEALYHNLWLQGETSHPEFVWLSRQIFEAAGLELGLIDEIWPSSLFATTNYFVATPDFWRAYLEFVLRVIDKARDKLSPHGRAMLHSAMADNKGMHASASYLPFIVERLFSTFLLTEGERFRAFKYPTAKSALEGQTHLVLLRQMRDVAFAQRSDWLASCWLNYRNLVLLHAHGKPWVAHYLKAITPDPLNFTAESILRRCDNPLFAQNTTGKLFPAAPDQCSENQIQNIPLEN